MRIAVTGGSGSLGRSLLRRFTAGGADRVVTCSRDEQKRAALQAEFGWHPGLRVYSADIRDMARLSDLFRGCEIVVHAAARKVVTAHPDEPEEMLKTNVLGTMNVIDACAAAGVQKLLIISSDKACRPENFYGVSKAAAETLAVNANARTYPRGLRIGVLRYGNVLASNGSVVRVWRDRMAAGQTIDVSHAAMTRFWLTLGQAGDHVEWALANLRGGEIVVPHLPAASLLTLADALKVDPLMIRMTGIRQGGEKLHEEMLAPSEVRRALWRGKGTPPHAHDGYFVVTPYQHAEMWDARPWQGEPVSAEQEYRSDTWARRLDGAGMRALLEGAE